MIMHIIDRNQNALTTVDTSSTDGVQITEPVITTTLINGTRLTSAKFTVLKTTQESALIDAAKYVVFQNGLGEDVCCIITAINDETAQERPVEADDLGMELLNGSASIFASEKAQTVDYYLNRELYDTGWTIGTNELGDDIKKLVDTSQDETPLSRIQRIATTFGCEITFTLDFQNLRIKHKYLNVYYAIGSDRSDTVFYSGTDVQTIRKSTSTDGIITAIEDTNHAFNDLSTGDGRYFTRVGESVVYDRESNALYGRGNTSEERFSGFINGTFASTETAPIDAYNEAVAQLETRNEPTFSADVDMLYKDGDFEVGDWITFVDEDYNPAMRMKARLTTTEIHPDDGASNSVTLANASMLRDMVSSNLRALSQQTAETATYVLRLSTDNGTGFVDGVPKTTTISATVTKDGEDITASLKAGDVVWFKTDGEGNHDSDWEALNGDAVGSVMVADTGVTDTVKIKCVLTIFQGQYVQAIYFLNGLKDVARKVLRLQNEHTVTSVHISDTHYATDTITRGDLENYSRSNNHVKNVAELSRMIGLDYIVHNGDTHDGGTANKDIALSNFREIVSTLGLAKCPYFVSWGNHDNNGWGDSRTNSINKTILNYKPSVPGTKGLHGKGAQMLSNAEMYDVATRPSTIFGIHENPDDKMGYYYYDVPDKAMRVIILNPQDIPDTLDQDGYLKYQGLNVAGYRQKQITWLYQTLASTPAGTTVAIYQHFGFGYRYSASMAYVPYNYELIDGIIDSFVLGTKFSGSYTANADFKASISTDFTGQQGKLAFLAHGHFHRDKLSKDANGINNYSIGCSVSRPKKDQADRPLGELQEDLWDVVVVNTATQHVNLVRFGAGKDREFDY